MVGITARSTACEDDKGRKRKEMLLERARLMAGCVHQNPEVSLMIPRSAAQLRIYGICRDEEICNNI